jgi:IclR family mhp operon transcriptional activator
MQTTALPQVKSIRALARGLDVLKALQERPATSLQDLHGDTGLSKPTLLRILRTLEEAGMVHRAIGDGRYRVSARVRFLGRDLSDHDAIAEQAAPVLDRLCRRVLWPSDIAVYKDGAMEILETSRQQTPFLVNRARMGYRVHMLMSAMGRAYLAFCPREERDRILGRLRRSTDPYDRRARERGSVQAVLQEDRRRGYATREPGYGYWVTDRSRAAAIAVPVMVEGRAMASINLCWVAGAVSTDEMVALHLAELQDAAAEIARGVAASIPAPAAQEIS